MLVGIVLMQHAFYFYLSIFVEKRYFYSVTLGYVLLVTFTFNSFIFMFILIGYV